MSNELDNLLDATLDDLADLPTFTPFPCGAHRVLATFKRNDEMKAVILDLTMIETIEYANPQDGETSPTKEGDTSNAMYQLGNKWGAGNFKKAAKNFVEHVGESGLSAIVDGVENVECMVLTGLRKDKNDPEKFYLDIKEITVL